MAYLHVVAAAEADARHAPPGWQPIPLHFFRPRFGGSVVGNSGFTAESGERAVASGELDAVAFGRPFIANADLVERFRRGAPLNVGDPATFYGGAERGYTDYPTLAG